MVVGRKGGSGGRADAIEARRWRAETSHSTHITGPHNPSAYAGMPLCRFLHRFRSGEVAAAGSTTLIAQIQGLHNERHLALAPDTQARLAKPRCVPTLSGTSSRREKTTSKCSVYPTSMPRCYSPTCIGIVTSQQGARNMYVRSKDEHNLHIIFNVRVWDPTRVL